MSKVPLLFHLPQFEVYVGVPYGRDVHLLLKFKKGFLVLLTLDDVMLLILFQAKEIFEFKNFLNFMFKLLSKAGNNGVFHF